MISPKASRRFENFSVSIQHQVVISNIRSWDKNTNQLRVMMPFSSLGIHTIKWEHDPSVLSDSSDSIEDEIDFRVTCEVCKIQPDETWAQDLVR